MTVQNFVFVELNIHKLWFHLLSYKFLAFFLELKIAFFSSSLFTLNLWLSLHPLSSVESTSSFFFFPGNLLLFDNLSPNNQIFTIPIVYQFVCQHRTYMGKFLLLKSNYSLLVFSLSEMASWFSDFSVPAIILDPFCSVLLV